MTNGGKNCSLLISLRHKGLLNINQGKKNNTQSSKQIVGKGLEQTFRKRRYPATRSPQET